MCQLFEELILALGNSGQQDPSRLSQLEQIGAFVGGIGAHFQVTCASQPINDHLHILARGALSTGKMRDGSRSLATQELQNGAGPTPMKSAFIDQMTR